MSTVVGTVKILGQELEVSASAPGGEFYIRDEQGKRIGAGETLEQAKTRARTALNKLRVEVAVPFVMVDGRRGVAIRRDARDRSIVVEFDGGQRDSLFANSNVLKADVPEDLRAELDSIEHKMCDLKARAREITREWEMRLSTRLDQAILEKAGQA